MNATFIIILVALTISIYDVGEENVSLLHTAFIISTASTGELSSAISISPLVVDIVLHRGIAVFKGTTLATTGQTSAPRKHASNKHTRGVSHCPPLRRCYRSDNQERPIYSSLIDAYTLLAEHRSRRLF